MRAANREVLHMTKRTRAAAFALANLLVALILIALLSAVAMGVVNKEREVNNRVNCAKNLMKIGQAVLLYSNENKGRFPRTLYDFKVEKWTAYTGWRAPDPFDQDKGRPPEVNDVTAAMFLLIRTQDISGDSFVCPSSDARRWDYAPLLEKDRKNRVRAQDRSNFPSPAFLSYSYANPYPNKGAVNAGYKLNNTVGAEFALAADMNPGGKELGGQSVNSPREQMKLGNSLNHARDGQNVLFGDGHVEFMDNSFAGALRDNIYTVSGSDDGKDPTSGTIAGSPRWAGDSVLLPTAQEKGDEKAQTYSTELTKEKGAR
jgi:prepilin-type processing-associated H-X9-DG protein